MIICHPRHPNHLSQDLNSILWTFLEQFAVVFLFLLCSFSPLRIEYSSFLLFLLLCCQQQKSEHHLEICIAYLVYYFPVSFFIQRVPHIFTQIKPNDPFYLQCRIVLKIENILCQMDDFRLSIWVCLLFYLRLEPGRGQGGQG